MIPLFVFLLLVSLVSSLPGRVKLSNPAPIIQQDYLLEISKHLDMKSQAALFSTSKEINTIMKNREPIFKKAQALYKNCPSWVFRRAIDDGWSVFASPKNPSLECLKTMKTNVDMLDKITTLYIWLDQTTRIPYLKALRQLLEIQSFKKLTIDFESYTLPIDKVFNLLKTAKCESLIIHTEGRLPSVQAFSNFSLNENIKHLEIDENLLPLFCNHFAFFKNLETIVSINGFLNPIDRYNLQQFRQLKNLVLRIPQDYENSQLGYEDLIPSSNFQGFYLTINDDQLYLPRPLTSLWLMLNCGECRMDIGLKNSITTLTLLNIYSYGIPFNPPFIHSFLTETKTLNALNLRVNSVSELKELETYASLDLKSFSIRFIHSIKTHSDSIPNFLSTQKNLEHFKIDFDSSFPEPFVFYPIMMALQTLNRLKTIVIDYNFLSKKFSVKCLPMFIDSLYGFSGKDVFINGVHVKTIIRDLDVENIPSDMYE